MPEYMAPKMAATWCSWTKSIECPMATNLSPSVSCRISSRVTSGRRVGLALTASIIIWVAHCQTRPRSGSLLSKPKYCRAPILTTGFSDEFILLEKGGLGEGGGRGARRGSEVPERDRACCGLRIVVCELELWPRARPFPFSGRSLAGCVSPAMRSALASPVRVWPN